jgi:transcription initiation factor TFIIE subunit alpha
MRSARMIKRKANSKKAKHSPKRAKRMLRRPTIRKRQVTKANEERKRALSRAAKTAVRKEQKLIAERNAIRQKEKEQAMNSENERMKVEVLLANDIFADFISKNVGKKAINIIRMLHTQQTDEKIAADLNLKINEVRRILNVLDSYGVARYDTSKDSKGWLTFNWYLNSMKLSELNAEVMNRKPDSIYKLQEDCNDFFYCSKCYDNEKVILPFDAAFENKFKCDTCGSKLTLLSRKEAASILERKDSSA